MRDRNYSPAVGAALSYAANAHVAQRRKQKSEWYLSHLLRVAALVMRYGGDETDVIAGLLHDCPEDQGGQARLDEIETVFGPEVATIVSDCSDSLTADASAKAPWRDRKLAHLEHLVHLVEAGSASLLVFVCDKLANLEDIINDIGTEQGSDAIAAVLGRFNGGHDGTIAYYSAVYELTAGAVPPEASTALRVMLETLVDLRQEGERRPADIVHGFVEATAAIGEPGGRAHA